MKEKKYRPTRKQLTRGEAITAATNAKQQFFTNEECIMFWRAKLGKRLDVMDLFILHTDGFENVEQYLEAMQETQQYKMLGNGWTVEVIKHIFSFLQKCPPTNN